MEIKLKDVNDDLIITRGGVSIKVFDALSSLLPPPVEGDVQIFDDAACTKYATGVKNQGDKVYARVNVPWGLGEGWYTSDPSEPETCIECYGPSKEYPSDPYVLHVWIDAIADPSPQQFTVGQVVELTWGIDATDVANYQKIFTKPTN